MINEVMRTPIVVGTSGGQWFEVYNRGASSVNLRGWQVISFDSVTGSDASFFISPPGTDPVTLAPGGYFVLASSICPYTEPTHIPNVNFLYHADFPLYDTLVLVDESGSERDRAVFRDAMLTEEMGRSQMLPSAIVNADNGVYSSWCRAENVSYGIVDPDGKHKDYGTPGGPNEPNCAT